MVGSRKLGLTKDGIPPNWLTPVLSEDQLDSGDYLQTLDRCLAQFGWAEKVGLKGKLIEGRYHGVGVGCLIEGGAMGPRENARMVLEGDGSVSVYVGSTMVAQGLETICRQIAADAVNDQDTDVSKAGARSGLSCARHSIAAFRSRVRS